MYVIAKDGSGDFTSIQAAVDAVSSGYRAPVILLVRAGEYHERVIINKDNIRLIGEDRDNTVITHSGYAMELDENGQEKGTFLSYTMLVTGSNVEVENLTVRNDAGDGRVVGQAVAVYAAGDRGTWRNCRMIAHQDTLFCGPTMPNVKKDAEPYWVPDGVLSVGDCPPVHARQYFEDCYIAGDVDFIFGPYRCWFERCTLFMNERGGWYTAANTPEWAFYGFVFHCCRLTGACAEGEALLGRPWRAFARTIFLDCEMDEHVSPEGFADWDEARLVTERCGENGTWGARADQSARHPKQKRLTEAEAELLTIAEVLSGYDQWHPDRRVPTWFLCGSRELEWAGALSVLAGDVFVQNVTTPGLSGAAQDERLHLMELCLRPGDKVFTDVSDGAALSIIETACRQSAAPVLISSAAGQDIAVNTDRAQLIELRDLGLSGQLPMARAILASLQSLA